MELHQNELENISDDILEYIILNVNYVNDIRTVFITHDKRLFSILSNSPYTRVINILIA
ncbi:hypothetical protein Psal071_02119 [Piscirickettsia salmonis]|uniref:Uncharacterized protein n=1 Tax=Piscirickettsia salmonis TaxID=1238 RepID=A0A9Q6LLL9_PISSA|nr:hypothetical protein Psal006a_01191 [Piscirickettsia salmonis]QGO06453.1 hypothetical protein Psal009_02368 [Piscirickettsia salmonis]QGO34779.1 hypothetical protein Psal028_02119 [Piscirickettsia salmonis]QGO38396.1 hypothetical protein Psal040_02125 [Piscirickettsia salmonis]QGO42012.1 hypothetical protein Psal041_02116 [Piscirickettsia salmonis]